MPLIDNIELVAFASKYPIDKIIASGTGSISLPAAADLVSAETSSASAPHGLGGNIVASGTYTIDGTNYYPLGTTVLGNVSSGQIEQAVCDVACDDTNVYVRATNIFLTPKTFSLSLFFESIA